MRCRWRCFAASGMWRDRARQPVLLADNGLLCSMSAKGNCYDNAAIWSRSRTSYDTWPTIFQWYCTSRVNPHLRRGSAVYENWRDSADSQHYMPSNLYIPSPLRFEKCQRH